MSLVTVLQAARAAFEDYKSKSKKQESIDKIDKHLAVIDSFLGGGIEPIMSIVSSYEESLILAQNNLKNLVQRNLSSSANLDIREKEHIKASSYSAYLELVDIQTSIWIQLEKLKIVVEKQVMAKKIEEIAAKTGVSPTAAKKQFEQTEEFEVLNGHMIYTESLYKTADSCAKVAEQFCRGTMQSVSVLNKEIMNK